MPLFTEWTIGDHGRAAIWKIEEPESFFAEQAGVTSAIKNDKRRAEYLAGRFLLKYLEKDFPVEAIEKDEHDKPRISNNRFFFSISHSWPYVAVLIDTTYEAGIDIQTWHGNITQIQHKFLSPAEQALFANDHKLLAAAWTAKEAAYKWAGRRGTEFIEHLPIQKFEETEEKNKITIIFKLSDSNQIVLIENILNIDFACSYVIFDE